MGGSGVIPVASAVPHSAAPERRPQPAATAKEVSGTFGARVGTAGA